MSFGSINFRGSFASAFSGTFGRAAGGIASSIQWLLRLATSYTAATGSGAVNSSTAQKVVEAFDATTGLTLVTVPDVSLTAPVPALRMATTVADGAVLGVNLNTQPTNLQGTGWGVAGGCSIDSATQQTFSSRYGRTERSIPTTVGSVYRIFAKVRNIDGNTDLFLFNSADSVGSSITVNGALIEYEGDNFITNSTATSIGLADRNFSGFGSAIFTDVYLKEIIPTFVNNDGSGSALHPVNADGEMKLIPWRKASEPYLLGDEIVTSVGVHNHYYTCTAAGTTAASAPTYTDSGVQPTDGDAVFTYAGRYSNLATSTVNHYPAVLTEKVATQQLLNSDVTATQTTGSLATGDYVLWQNGSGSSDLTAGTATISTTGSATDGSPLTFTVSGAGTVTVTITGGPPDEFQLEGGSTPSSFITSAGAVVTRPADALTSVQLITAERLALRYTGNGTPRTLLSDGTNVLAWSGTAVTFTDGVTTLTYTGALAYGSTIAIDFIDGTLTIGGTLRDTDAALDPTWGAITVLDSVSDMKADSTIDLTDIIGD